MRTLAAILVLVCASCGPSREDMLSEAERAQREMLARAQPDHALETFGGTIQGKDRGEWGGEVAFRTSDGTEHQLIGDNSRGIFGMPFGVIVVTGLAHLGENRGSVHLASKDASGRVTTAKTIDLSGWPCEVVASETEIMLRVFQGYGEEPDASRNAKYDCFALRSPYNIVPTSCPAVVPQGCFQ